uniref:Uncharacterized protein n=1 Tax=Micrurus surinamensis TaxID=129470 RepID=A0A2D4Q0F4_MICSU
MFSHQSLPFRFIMALHPSCEEEKKERGNKEQNNSNGDGQHAFLLQQTLLKCCKTCGSNAFWKWWVWGKQEYNKVIFFLFFSLSHLRLNWTQVVYCGTGHVRESVWQTVTADALRTFTVMFPLIGLMSSCIFHFSYHALGN